MQKNISSQCKISIQKKLILIICGLLISVIFLEIGLRVGGPIFSFLQEYRNKASIYKKGTYRIMCLGESTTAGGKGSYPGQLEEVLNERNTGIKFNVINKGMGGVNSSTIISQLEDNLNKYKPDMVIAMMGDNDRYIKYYEDIPEVNTFFFNKFRTYRLVRILWMHLTNKMKKAGSYKIRFTKLHSNSLRGYRSEQTNIAQSEEVLSLNSKKDEAYADLGQFYIDRGMYAQAEEVLNKAIKVNPKNDRIYRELGFSYRLQGKHAEAEEAFEKALELNPKN
jgi:tetratricopeptide (TPR) repeat protein